jgi:hypothetical protein
VKFPFTLFDCAEFVVIAPGAIIKGLRRYCI